MPLDEPFERLAPRSLNDRAIRVLRQIRHLWFTRTIHWLKHWFIPDTTQWAERWYVWIPIGLMIGVCCYFSLLFEPPVWAGPLAVAVMAAAYFAISDRTRTISTAAIITILLICTGFSAAQLRTSAVRGPILMDETRPVMVQGEVTSVEYRDNRIRLTINSVAISDMETAVTPKRVRISMSAKALEDAQDALLPGDKIAVRAILRPPPGPSYPGGYNFARQLFYQQIGAVGFSVGDLTREPNRQEAPDIGRELLNGIETIRQRITLRIMDILPDETGGVATALLTGQRGGISEATYDDIRRAGIAHLLAISGLHLGVMSGWLFLVSRLLLAAIPGLALYHPIKKYSAAIALVGTAAYVLLAGAPIPTIRAFIMVGLGIGAVWIDRDPFSLRLVGIAAIGLILTRPETVVGPSFQMSFAAVTALIATYQFFKARGWIWQQNRGQGMMPRLGRFMIGLCLTTVIASLATAPFAIYHFQQVATFGLVGNLVGVPMASLWIIPLGMISLFLMPFGLEYWPMLGMGYGIDLLLQASADVADLPYASLATLALKPIVVGIMGMLILLTLARIMPIGLLCLGIIATTLGSTVWQPSPRLIASQDGDLIGIPDLQHSTLYLSQTRRGTFTADQWRRRLGDVAKLDWSDKSADGMLTCDGDGCISTRPDGAMIVIARTHGAVFEDCGIADLIILPSSNSHGCDQSQIITRRDIQESDGLAVYQERGVIVIKTVAGLIGDRPWHPRIVETERVSIAARDQSDDLGLLLDLH